MPTVAINSKGLSKSYSEDEKKNALKKQQRDSDVIAEYKLKDDGYKSRIVTPRRSVFDLRSKEMRTEGEKKQGRLYSTKKSKDVGGLRVDEMIYGVKMAHLSCTDDSEMRLNNPKASANSLMALEHLVGGDDPKTTIGLPLSQILEENFGLKLDCHIDESGIRKGRPVDTQGFIASNEDTIVLSYRFTTTIMDWMANLTFFSSEWEPVEDEALGHAGWCSSTKGWFTKFCRPNKAKPRVHTAYYNNFIYTIPMIKKYIIEPLKKENAKPKKIYVVGCSLGAAISQIAFCYILEQLYENLMDPEFKNVERLVSVTAGCPRVGDRKFRNVMMKKMEALRKAGLDRAVINRLVYNKDIVPHAPPNVIAFCHLGKLVYITRGGEHVIINPDISKQFTKYNEIKVIYRTVFEVKKEEVKEKKEEIKQNIRDRQTVVAGKAKDKLQSVHTKMHMSVESGTKNVEGDDAESGTATATKHTIPLTKSKLELDAEAATEAAAAEGKEKSTKEAFEEECKGAMEGIHDHMPYWYLTHLEKLRDEENAKNGGAEADAENLDEELSC